MSKDDRDKSRYECYLNIQSQEGSIQSNGLIIFGNGDTAKEAKMLFDHALEAYHKEKAGK